MYKTILVLVCLLFGYLLYPQKADAISPWTKAGIVTFQNTSTWNSSYNRTPSVIFQNNQYRMWFDGYDGNTFRIGYAFSHDGINWVNNTNPVLDGSSNNQHYLEPFVLYDENKFKIWFLSINKLTNETSINYSESIDGIEWSTPVISLSPSDSWEIQHLAHPHVIREGNVYRLFYNGQSNGQWKIGYAESTDGISWDKYSNNPLLTPNNDESPTIAGAYVLKEGSRYLMYYHSKNPATNIRLATSEDGLHWTKQDIVLSTSPNNFDSIAMISPSLIRDGNQYKLFYSGFNGNTWKIGYATKPVDINPVPLLKQTSNPWQSHVYDSANLWSPGNSTISRWGCAVTSLAMVLNYHGYFKLPDNKPLNPGTLNTWLKSQSDGYVSSGLVNWHAISRLSKQATTINSISDFDALEFSYGGSNKNILTQDLNNSNPVILEEPGHFIVATEPNGNTFLINDPYYDRYTLNDGYSNSFTSMRRYIPSNTDLSYFMIVSDPSLSITVKNNAGIDISDNLLQNPIQDPQSNLTSGTPTKVTFVSKPNNGNYSVHISTLTPQKYNFSIYIYDENGEVIEKDLSGYAHQNANAFSITFNKTDNTKTLVNKIVTHSSILKDLDVAYKNRLVHIGMYNSLKQIIINSHNEYKKKRIFNAKLHLQTSIQLASSPAKVLNDTEYSNTVITDLKTLYSTL